MKNSIHMQATGLVLGSVYTFCLIVFFVEWTLFNPFSFVAEIPSMSTDDRGGLLSGIGVMYLIAYGSAGIYRDTRTPNEKEEVDSGAKLYDRSYSVIAPISTRSGPDAVDIAVGVGLGIVGSGIVSDIFGIDD